MSLAPALLAQALPREVVIHSHAYTPPSAILRADTTLVEAAVVVRDGQGRTIGGLRADDFQVLDGGTPQKIVAFSELRSNGMPAAAPPELTPAAVPPASIPPRQPRFVTFFFDDFHGGAGMFMTKAAREFIAKGLKPGDWLSIVTASGQGDLDFTSDAQVFAERLNHIASHRRSETTMYCGVGVTESYIVLHNLDYQTIEAAIDAAKPCACGGAETAADCRSKALPVAQQMATMTWEQSLAQSVNTIDALGFAAKRLSQRNGSRILVVNSTGFLVRPNQPEVRSFVDGCVRWNIVIHAIDGGGLAVGGGRTALLRQSLYWMPLEEITDGTGGHFFKNTNDLAGAMELAANPEFTYLVAFSPSARDGKFHTLKIRFAKKRPEMVQFRPGYFSPLPEARKPSARDAMDAAVFSGDRLSEISAAVTVTPQPPKDGVVPVVITVAVDMRGIQFTQSKGRHMQQIVFLMTLLDPEGGFVTGKEAIMDMALTDTKLASLQEEGLRAVATLKAPSGVYRVRTVVREAMKGRLAAWTTPVELRAK